MSNPYLPITPGSSSSNIPNLSFAPSSSFNPYSKSTPDGPITRSRTLFYLSVRDSSSTYSSKVRKSDRQYGDTIDIGDDEEQIGLIGNSSTIPGKGLPPKWVDISDEVEEILSRAKIKISVLDKLHAKHVLPGFTDRTAEEREIERQTSDITRDFRRCTSLISSVQPTNRATRVEITTAKNVQRGLAQKVQDLSGMFRKKQRVYMQKLQGHAIKNKDLMVASGAITLKGVDLLDELEEDEQASHNQMQSQSQQQSTSAIDIDIQQRSNEITQIASSISELADLFRDLGNLVVEQGTVLDSVEYNVQMTARELKGAEEELKVAQRYQANTGRRKCILFLFLCILGLIIILIYKPRSNSSSTPIIPIISSSPTSSATTYIDDIVPSYKSVLQPSAMTTSKMHEHPHGPPLAKPPPLPTNNVPPVGGW
ncbi:uncharacterized protein I206_107818 [Kwoniella pini CBS 10737]|uniref:t-SNARE coiled-coil homology domain-containing protein n=1 Tax=Kwoniella pini CBS 10737 TaxID=1296096 RepID=A0A1B9HYC1_9TREE|nr:uncharacterized protein I206_06151 [Kwoniella pini CBS 10737]OCF48283.1 hypothetical protein I206_06151 [Kwoniella pini CBS 10737]